MSHDNVEIVRRMIDLANRREVEALGQLVAPDIECFPASEQPDSKPFRGRDAFAEYARDWLEVFDQYVIEPSEYLDRGDYVVLIGRVVACGRDSGAETAEGGVWLYRFRNGKAIEYRECGTKEQALEALGLRE